MSTDNEPSHNFNHIPAFWHIKEIREIGLVVTGKTPPTKEDIYWDDNDYPFITPSDISGYEIRYLSAVERMVSKKWEQKSKNYLLPPNTVCFVCIGSTIGKMCLIKHYSFTNQQINSVIAATEIDPMFLYYALRNRANNITRIYGGEGAVKAIINKSTFERIKILMPQRKVEQITIADILSNLDSKIELNQQMNKTLESIAQTLFKHWFIDFEFPDENGQPYKSSGGEMVETEMGKIPANFAVRTLENEIELKYGKSLPEQTRKRGQYPVYGSNGIVGFHNEFVEEAPGIIIGRKGSAGSVKFSHDNFWAIDTTYYVHLTRKHDTYFWYYLLKTLNLESMNSHSAVPGLNRKDLLQLHYLKPSPEILHRFNSLISIFKKKEQILLKENSILIDIRDSLLPELISGKIRVPLEDTNV